MQHVIVLTHYSVSEGQPPISVIGPYEDRGAAVEALRKNDWKEVGYKWLNAGMWAFIQPVIKQSVLDSFVVSIPCETRA